MCGGSASRPSPVQRVEENRAGNRYAVSPGYFETMRIPLRRGPAAERAATERGRRSSLSSTRVFARHRLPGLDPIGQRLRIGPQGWFTIVGVVGDVKQTSLIHRPAQTRSTSPTPSGTVRRTTARWLVIRATSTTRRR